jgi:hypothetical protein
MPKRPRSEGSTPTDAVNPPKKPMNSTGPEIYWEAVTNVRIAFLKENYPGDKLSEDDTLESCLRIVTESKGRRNSCNLFLLHIHIGPVHASGMHAIYS